MKIGSIGYNHVHDKYFLMDRPEGTGCYLFLLIKSTALFTINGIETQVKAGSAVIFTPESPCSYHALDDVYTDDWFYFSADEDDLERFSELGIPLDEVFYLGGIDELSRIMYILTCEHYSAEPYHTQIEENYLNILLMKLSRMIGTGVYFSPHKAIERNSALTYIRSRIFTRPDSINGVDSLAEEAGLSRSGFQHLYKKMFGVSVMHDIISGRLERSKRLLVSTELSVSEIAASCGYSNAYAFMRQFKQKCGVTPSQYRKSN